jgi:hypothetical protein
LFADPAIEAPEQKQPPDHSSPFTMREPPLPLSFCTICCRIQRTHADFKARQHELGGIVRAVDFLSKQPDVDPKRHSQLRERTLTLITETANEMSSIESTVNQIARYRFWEFSPRSIEPLLHAASEARETARLMRTQHEHVEDQFAKWRRASSSRRKESWGVS